MTIAAQQVLRVGSAVWLGVVAGSCAATSQVGPLPGAEVTYEVRPASGRPVAPADGAVLPQDDGSAADAASPDWTFTASLYLWLAHKRGVVETGKLGIPLDDPDEAAGAFLYLEGDQGQWGFIVDLDLLSSEDEADIVTGKVEVDEDTIIGEADVTYRLESEPSLQFLAGLRVLDSQQDITLPNLPDESTDTTQVDLVLGAQGTWALTERFNFRLRGDIGGFGLDSDSTYQLVSLFGWEFAQRWQLTAGYRVLGWEFDDGDARSDLRLQGALLGVAATF